MSDYTLTPNPKLPGSDIGWNCISADGKIEVYGETQEEARLRCEVAQLTQQRDFAQGRSVVYAITSKRLERQMAAEKLRADRLAESVEYALRVGYKSDDCGDHCSNACYWCELRAALALGGKEQK